MYTQLQLKHTQSSLKLMQGAEACAEGAIAAGCRFFAGYPITPSINIMKHMSQKLAAVKGVFIQMEDEIASISAVLGASMTGMLAMTATSGPGFSLMAESIGYGLMTETPCVVVNIQRVGPSTGQATRPSQSDVMNARWVVPGDYEIIVLCPYSVQEMYELTIEAFKLSQKYRIPVILLSEASLAYLKETIDITKVKTQEILVDKSKIIGRGNRLIITGSTHNEKGYRKTSDPDVQKKLSQKLCNKVLNDKDLLTNIETTLINDADVLVVAYGIVARSALKAVKQARENGIKAGLVRLINLWPFPDEKLKKVCNKIKKIIVPEMNSGQIIREIERCISSDIVPLNKFNGEVIEPCEILKLLS